MKLFKFGFRLAEQPQLKDKSEIALTAEELEKLLLNLLKDHKEDKQTMWNLVRLYKQTNRLKDAFNIASQLLHLSENDEERAFYFMQLGALMELMNDYEHAAEYYQEGFLLKPSNKQTWYFMNNNLGYSLNQLQRFEEAKGYLLTAVKTDPTRSNAYKNLGLCFQGLCEYTKALKCFIAAIKADAADSRPLNHLKDLLREHPELNGDFPGLEENLNSCEKVVELARKMQPDFDASWQDLRRQFN